ncbi:MAG TPA: hypothetical protein VGG97_15155 [Bryobacteraceae bacterium]|jgi:hypothetical protein
MRILLDESVPQKLRLLIDDHTVVTVAFKGWSGLKNGVLLTAAEEAGFELLITADQEISYPQNLSGRKLEMLVLSTNNWDYVKGGVSRIIAAIAEVKPGSYAEVEIPE